jgi:hypothetical protein
MPGLRKDVIDRMIEGAGEDGKGRLFDYNLNRVEGFLWKVARGLYSLGVGKTLPQLPPGGIRLSLLSAGREQYIEIPWFREVARTSPMGAYGSIFEYRWLGWKNRDSGNPRTHARDDILERSGRGDGVSRHELRLRNM